MALKHGFPVHRIKIHIHHCNIHLYKSILSSRLNAILKLPSISQLLETIPLNHYSCEIVSYTEPLLLKMTKKTLHKSSIVRQKALIVIKKKLGWIGGVVDDTPLSC